MYITKESQDKLKVKISHNIYNNFEDIAELIDMQNFFIKGQKEELDIIFEDCEFINAAVSVLIGTLPIYAHSIGKRVFYSFKSQDGKSINHPIFKFMKKVGMYDFYNNNQKSYSGENVIPFDRINDDIMMDEYTNRIMDLAPIKMMEDAKNILASYFYEVYQNSFAHSKSQTGVFSSGFWIPEEKDFTFSIYDMGIGIPESIRSLEEYRSLTDEQCLDIAFTKGFTTIRDDGVCRGLGLAMLEEFIKLNQGRLSMYTNGICCEIRDDSARKYTSLQAPIIGILIIINIFADTKHIYIVNRRDAG